MDENVQYLLLALYWWFNKPIFSAYFCIFSLRT